MILWGTNNYTLKKFKPEDLGLYTNEYDRYTFQISQSYFHLYFIPLIPTGTNYTFSRHGSSDKFHAPENFRKLMEQHSIPFWHRLGAWALPLIAAIGFFIFSISSKMEHAKYEKQAMAMKSQMETLTKDTAKLSQYPQKINSVYEIIRNNFNDKKEGYSKIDTSSDEVFMAYLQTLGSVKDTVTNFTDSNTIIFKKGNGGYGFAFLQDEKNEISDEDIDIKWGGDYSIENTIKWYKDGMQKEGLNNINPDNFENANEVIANKKYIAVIRLNGVTRPTVISEAIESSRYKKEDEISKMNSKPTPGYNTGFAKANVYLYNIETKKLLFTFKVFAQNSSTISTYTRSNENASGAVREKLENDLSTNLINEVEYALRIKQRKNDDY
jgi:hypothetical protein